MRIKTVGRPVRVTVNEVTVCMEYCSGLLLPLNKIKTIELDLSFKRYLLRNEGVQGDIEPIRPVEGVDPHEFIMRMDHFLHQIDAIAVTCHEAVHIEQVATGRLLEREDCFVWEGNRHFHLDTPYEQAPWEIEACRRGQELYTSFSIGSAVARACEKHAATFDFQELPDLLEAKKVFTDA